MSKSLAFGWVGGTRVGPALPFDVRRQLGGVIMVIIITSASALKERPGRPAGRGGVGQKGKEAGGKKGQVRTGLPLSQPDDRSSSSSSTSWALAVRG